jgi:putative transposase
VQVFTRPADFQRYQDLVREYSELHRVSVVAYCLMPNHVHLVLVPTDCEGLHNLMRPVSMRYAQYLNRARKENGVVWQGRYFSAALDDAYLWNAVRYVERNPVRANLAGRAECYPWSSAGAHCGLRADSLLSRSRWERHMAAAVGDWSEWLAEADDGEVLAELRSNTPRGLPCGSAEFVDQLERSTGRVLKPGVPGRRRSVRA